MLIDLLTPEGEELLASGATPWQAYPRPQMKRDSYVNLCGKWDFTVSPESKLPKAYDRQILVPFCPESQLSGLKLHPKDGDYLFYRRSFTLPEGFQKDRVLLHIGAVDQVADIYVNQKCLFHHENGYESFTVDITDALQEENELIIRATDNLNDRSYPYGKQKLKRGTIFYTPTSGIWLPVWLESVCDKYIKKLDIQTKDAKVTVTTVPALEGKVTVEGLGEYILENGSVTIAPEDPHLWSPEDPFLYAFTVETQQDKVESYFALRTLEIKKVGAYQRLCLNGKPYFFHGLLDQGYWSDGLLTPAIPGCYEKEILAMKALGFNTLRKHIKIEPEQFYYDCDRLGMIVFQDMVNNGKYSFFRDAAMPNAGIKKLDDRFINTNKRDRAGFRSAMRSCVAQLKNHPCICYWTIFNESWGQFDSDNVFEEFLKLDDTRFVDSTSGWYHQKKSQVDSYHVYFKSIQIAARPERPLVLSEFGGYTYSLPGHIFNTEKEFSYRSYPSREALNQGIEQLYLEQIVPMLPKGLCAAIYTQVSDVEDEINGVLTYDRRISKLDEDRMKAIAAKLKY